MGRPAVRRAVAVAVLMLLGLVALPGVASASSACPTCIGHRDKAGGDYVVKAGDTLSGIAAAHRTAGGAASLYARNGDVLTSPDRIYVGQRLLVGTPLRASAAAYTLVVQEKGQQIARLHIPSAGNIVYKIVPSSSNGGATVLAIGPSPNGAVYVLNATRSSAYVLVLQNGTTFLSQNVYSYGQLHFALPTTKVRS